jgi:hypothetical protein
MTRRRMPFASGSRRADAIDLVLPLGLLEQQLHEMLEAARAGSRLTRQVAASSVHQVCDQNNQTATTRRAR